MGNERVTFGTEFRKGRNNVGFIPYDSNSPTSIKIDTGLIWRKLNLHLQGSLNISGSPTLAAEAPLRLIKKITVTADGNERITVAGCDLYRLGQMLESAPGALVGSAATGATVPFEAIIPLHFIALRKARPIDSAFDSDPYKEIKLEITWAPLSSIITGGTVTLNSGCGVRVVLEETTDGHDEISLIKVIKFSEKEVTTATDEFEIDVPDLALIEGMLIRADRDAVPVDDLITFVNIESSEGRFKHDNNIPWQDFQSMGQQDLAVAGGTANTQRITGYGYVDLTEEGQLTSALNGVSSRSLKVRLSVVPGSGTTRIVRVTFIAYEPKPNEEAA